MTARPKPCKPADGTPCPTRPSVTFNGRPLCLLHYTAVLRDAGERFDTLGLTETH